MRFGSGFAPSTTDVGGSGLGDRARLNGDKARVTREKIRSIGHGSAIDDYIFEWADKSHRSDGGGLTNPTVQTYSRGSKAATR